MKISVSAADIRLGKQWMTSISKCPVGRAFRRAGLKNVGVAVYTASNTKTNRTLNLPTKVGNAIRNMIRDYVNRTNFVKPFSFNLTKKQVAILS